MEQQQTDGQKKLTNRCCNTAFSLDMAFHILLKEAACNKASNFVFSPLSFHSMLCLIAVGAKGTTLERLLPILGSNSLEELNSLTSQIFLPMNTTTPIVSFLNTAWVDQKFKLKPAFEKIASEVYSSTIKQVDFISNAKEVEDSINLWANQATKGLVETLLPEGSIKEDTTLVLANALYFKGQWDRKFDPSRTQIRNFHLLNSEETVAIPFMTTKTSHKHLYKSFDGYKVLKIPYQNTRDTTQGTEETNQFAMNFFLPDAKDGLPDLVNRIRTNPAMLSNHSDELLLQPENLQPLWIPRFKLSFEMEASKTLKELGLGMVLNQGELTEMVDCGAESVAVSKMFHKACIEVNEEGTEAAAGTAPRIVRKARRVNPPSFVADHAFVFTVVEEMSGIVLFIGAVVNPRGEQGSSSCTLEAGGETIFLAFSIFQICDLNGNCISAFADQPFSSDDASFMLLRVSAPADDRHNEHIGWSTSSPLTPPLSMPSSPPPPIRRRRMNHHLLSQIRRWCPLPACRPH
ncbi:At1g47710 [Linum grandiflorum]